MYRLLAALVPPDVVTRTLAVPAIPGGVVAVIEVSLEEVTVAATDREDVITRLPTPVGATATNRPLP